MSLLTFAEIPFSQAFAHAWTEPSFVFTFFLGNLAGLTIVFLVLRKGLREKTINLGGLLAIFVGLVIILASTCYRAGNISANTTPEQAARGVFIGW